MGRSLKSRALFVSLQALPVVLIVATTACGRSPEMYVSRGDRLAAQGKSEDALLLYRKALQRNPAFGLAYLRLGALEARRGQTQEAFLYLSRAVNLMPRDAESRVSLANLCLALFVLDSNRPTILKRTLAQMASELGKLRPGEFDTWRIVGMLALVEDRAADAIAPLRQAQAIHRSDHNVGLSLVRALYLNGQGDDAAAAGREWLAHDPGFHSMYDELFSHTVGDLPAAQRIREEEVRNNPKSAEALLALASFYSLAGNLSGRDAILDRLAHGSDFPDGMLAVSQFLFDRKDLERARAYVGTGAHSHPEDFRYVRLLALIQLGEAKPEEARQTLSEGLRQHPDNPVLRSLQASLLVESGVPADISRARKEFEDLLRRSPNEPDYLYGLGRALFLQGEFPQARTAFQRLLGLTQDPTSARLALGEVSLAMNQEGAARSYADAVLQTTPNHPGGRLLRAKSLVFSGNTTDGLRELKELSREYPRWLDVTVEIGRAYLAMHDWDQAEAMFRAGYQPGHSDFRLIQGLTATALARGKADEVVSLWNAEIEKSQDPLPARRGLAAEALLIGRFDLAAEQYRRVLQQDPSDAMAYDGLAHAYQSTGSLPQAADAARKACDLQPSSLLIRAELAALLSDMGRWGDAADEYRKALVVEPDNAMLLNNAANALAEAGRNLDDAERLAGRAVQALPSERTPKDTLAWVYVRQHKPDTAIPILRALVNQDPDRVAFRYHLALALAQKGQPQAARTELNRALHSRPSAAQQEAIQVALSRLPS